MLKQISKLKTRIIAKALIRECGKNLKIGHSSHIKGHKQISIGDNFFSGPYLYLNTNKISRIDIGHDVMLGPFVKLISGNHVLDYKYGPMNSAPHKKKGQDKGIKIEDDVWIGTSSILLDGCLLSEGVVIGAGSIVTKYIPPYVIAAGNPAKIIKPRFSISELEIHLKAKNSRLHIEGIRKEYLKYGIVYD